MENDRKFVDGISNRENTGKKLVDLSKKENSFVVNANVEKKIKIHWSFFKSPYFIFAFLFLIVFAGWLAIDNLLNIKENIVNAASSGVISMQEGVNSMKSENYVVAAEHFALANRDFSSIEKNLSKLGHDGNFLGQSLPSDQYDQVVSVVDGLEAMSRGAKFLAIAMDEISEYSGDDFSGLLFSIVGNEQRDEDIFTLLSRVSEYIQMSSDELSYSIGVFDGIDESLIPGEYRQMYEMAKGDVPRYMNLLQGINSFFNNSEDLLGKDVPAKYLLLFQNNNEIRPTGGFIGSYGIATFSEGKMTDIYFDDIYNPDGQILEEIDPPYPINMMTTEWGMRDSNWYPDYPMSADNVVRMYEKEGGYTVDGVIAFTPEVVNRLLDMTGSITMDEYDVVLTGDNFSEVMQRKIELEADPSQGSPKKILADLMPVLIDRMQNLPEEKKQDFWQMALDLMYERHIMLFVYDDEVESLIQEIGWGGNLVENSEKQDYLAMIHSNIGGRKSDLYIRESVRQDVDVMADGSVVVDLEITRRNIEDWTWPNYSNYDYLRVYVPQGSELLAVDGFKNAEGVVIGDDEVLTYDKSYKEAGLANTKVYEESGKTVFANWIVTDPWDISVVSYKYLLPFKVSDSYSLYLQKQAGRNEIDYILNLDSDGRTIAGTSVEPSEKDDGLVFKSDLLRDFELNVLYE